MTTSVVRWHDSRPAWYFRAGEPLDGVDVNFTENDKIAISGVPRFGNKLAFTGKCTVLDVPNLTDPNKPPTVTLSGDDLSAFLAQVRELLRGRLRDRLSEEVATDTFISASISDCLRFKRWKDGKPTARNFPRPGSSAIVMGFAKPHVATGEWGLSVTILEIEEIA